MSYLVLVGFIFSFAVQVFFGVETSVTPHPDEHAYVQPIGVEYAEEE